MSQHPKITVVIPTCDRPGLLREALISVKQQTEAPYEIIIVNNGSNYLNKDITRNDNIKVFNIMPYAGASQSRNFGAFLAEGDYIAFLDDDDLWGSQYIELVATAIYQGAQCVISRLDQFKSGEIMPFKNIEHKLSIDHLFTYNPGITGSNIVIAKNVFFQIGGFDVRLPTSEDKSLIIELLKKNCNTLILPDNQAIIRQHYETKRLSEAEKIADGTYQFTKKYRQEMTAGQIIFNISKVINYRMQSGNIVKKLLYSIMFIFVAPYYLYYRIMIKKASQNLIRR